MGQAGSQNNFVFFACIGMGDACGMTKSALIRCIVVGFALYVAVAVWANAADDANTPARPAITARPVQSQTVTMHGPTVTAPLAPAVAAVEAAESFESQPINFPSNAHANANAANNPNRAPRSSQVRGASFSFGSLVSLLAVVCVACGLFIGVLYLVKRFLPGHKQLFSHPAMEVLGRTHLDQKRYVSLLRVGKRVLVVGVSQDEIHSLSEITDEEEITAILEVARPKTEMGLTLFQRLFQRTVLDNAKAETKARAQAEAEELAEQMSSLRNRVLAIRENEEPSRQSHRVDALG